MRHGLCHDSFFSHPRRTQHRDHFTGWDQVSGIFLKEKARETPLPIEPWGLSTAPLSSLDFLGPLRHFSHRCNAACWSQMVTCSILCLQLSNPPMQLLSYTIDNFWIEHWAPAKTRLINCPQRQERGTSWPCRLVRWRNVLIGLQIVSAWRRTKWKNSKTAHTDTPAATRKYFGTKAWLFADEHSPGWGLIANTNSGLPQGSRL